MRSRTGVRSHGGSGETNGFRAAVSLHSHTNCSKEMLGFLPYYVHRMPIVSGFARSAVARYETRSGWKADFSRAYWTPPVSPAGVLESERAQIAGLDLEAFVSITDHDTIEAGLQLTQARPAETIPISVEWTVPFEASDIHLGVHNLPVARASQVMQILAAYTRDRQASALPELLSLLDGFPDVLVVLNHPLWDHRRVGLARHTAAMLKFLSAYRNWIHALEISGLRSWRENREVLGLAEQCDLPAVAGGDRHGRQPNPVLNLTSATTWQEYVADVRQGLRSEVLLMPKYWVPPRVRDLEVIADALRHYHRYPYGQRRYLDRVFADIEGYGYHPLAFYWDGRIRFWLTFVLKGAVAVGSPKLQPVLHWMMSSPDHARDGALMTPATGPAWQPGATGVPGQAAMGVPVAQRSTSQH